MKPKNLSRLPLVLVLVVVVAGGVAAGVWGASRGLPKRFAVVAEGKLYRSGTVTPTQLEHLHKEYAVRRVVSLLNPAAPESTSEQAAAQRLGISWCNVPLPGNGASTPDERARILALLTDPTAGPTLVHCAAGATRTGLAVGLYRLRVQGWPLDQVLAEMRAFGFEDEAHHDNLRRALAAEAATCAKRAAEHGAGP